MVDKKETSEASFSTRFDMHVGCGCTVRLTNPGAIFITKPRVGCNVAEKSLNIPQFCSIMYFINDVEARCNVLDKGGRNRVGPIMVYNIVRLSLPGTMARVKVGALGREVRAALKQAVH